MSHSKKILLVASLCVVPALLTGAGCKPYEDKNKNNANTNATANLNTHPNANKVNTNATSQEVKVEFPNGKEKIALADTVTIRYTMSDELQDSLAADDVVELYLLNDKNTVAGYIGGITDYAAETYTWKPVQLKHWNGKDTTVSAPEPGDYRMLLVVRPRATTAANANRATDLLEDGQTHYDLTKKSLTTGDQGAAVRVISADASDEPFQIVK